MNKIKSKTDIILLNYNDLAFFLNESTTDAKWKMAEYFFNTENIEDNLTKTGIPKIKKTDLVKKSDFETKIRSCSELEGLNSIDFIIETYNKGIPIDRLYKYSEDESFIKSLKFTGKNDILNDILERGQLKKVQKTWLMKNTYMVNEWSVKCKTFIKNNDWSIEFLKQKGIDELKINSQMKDF